MYIQEIKKIQKNAAVRSWGAIFLQYISYRILKLGTKFSCDSISALFPSLFSLGYILATYLSPYLPVPLSSSRNISILSLYIYIYILSSSLLLLLLPMVMFYYIKVKVVLLYNIILWVLVFIKGWTTFQI